MLNETETMSNFLIIINPTQEIYLNQYEIKNYIFCSH